MNRPDTETLAENLAAHGRDELVARLREAYAKALGTHSDLVSFDSQHIEAMVQHSAADADGLQWRRALAGVAVRELGIDLGSALNHPAVVRAHQLVGAPSYETGLAALAAPEIAAVEEPQPVGSDAGRADEVAPDELTEAELTEAQLIAEEVAGAELTEAESAAEEAAQAESVEEEAPAAVPIVDQPTMAYDALVPEPAPADDDAPSEVEAEVDVEAEANEESSADVLAHRAAEFAEEFMTNGSLAAVDEPPVSDELTFEQDAVGGPMTDEEIAEFGAVHLGGVASLPSAEEIGVRLSEDGLDLLQDDGTIVGRLGWSDIAALEVTIPHGRRRRRNAPRLVVHTAGGSARFEVPGLSPEELQDQVQPLMVRFGQ